MNCGPAIAEDPMARRLAIARSVSLIFIVLCELLEITAMIPKYSKIFFGRKFGVQILAGLACLLCLGLSGCASVSSTSAYYLPYTTDIYPPKPKDAPIPILGKVPNRRYKTIGRLAFSTTQGWRFLRESMLYNARANGADAVLLKDTSSRRETAIVNVPPRFNWIPVSGPACRDNKGNVYYNTTYIPDYQPGYSYPTSWTITGIDSEMIVFKK